jgi:hypothetical protein
MDATRLGQVTADLMDHLNEDPPGESAELGEVLVLAEVKVTDPEGDWTYIAWRCSDERAWVQLGLMHAALDQEREVGDEDD